MTSVDTMTIAGLLYFAAAVDHDERCFIRASRWIASPGARIGHAIVQQIRSGMESSTVQVGPAPFLGVELSDASSSEFGYPGAALEEPSGAIVEGIVSGTAAAQAGLEAGDQITALGGHAVTSAEDVAALLANHDPGDRIKIGWIDQAGSMPPQSPWVGVRWLGPAAGQSLFVGFRKRATLRQATELP